MKAEITKSWSFDAAHQLPHHFGKCQNLHGHTYKVTVAIYDEIKPIDGSSDEGMVLDYYHISKVWKDELEPVLDHKYLNDTIPIPVTTAENLATWILGRFIEEGVNAFWVEVCETGSSSAKVYSQDLHA